MSGEPETKIRSQMTDINGRDLTYLLHSIADFHRILYIFHDRQKVIYTFPIFQNMESFPDIFTGLYRKHIH
jgi:hypothetical protein